MSGKNDIFFVKIKSRRMIFKLKYKTFGKYVYHSCSVLFLYTACVLFGKQRNEKHILSLNFELIKRLVTIFLTHVMALGTVTPLSSGP